MDAAEIKPTNVHVMCLHVCDKLKLNRYRSFFFYSTTSIIIIIRIIIVILVKLAHCAGAHMQILCALPVKQNI